MLTRFALPRGNRRMLVYTSLKPNNTMALSGTGNENVPEEAKQ